MAIAIKHPVPDQVKLSFVILTSGHSDSQGGASEYPDVKNYKCLFNPVWHRMLYRSCAHVAMCQRVKDEARYNIHSQKTTYQKVHCFTTNIMHINTSGH